MQVLGSAIHPNFVQYQLEYGPEPNPNNLWYTIGAPRQTTVLNGVLGIWSTNTIPDGTYQLRLRVYLRDGSNPQTVVNNIRVQNRPNAPTIVPTPTSSIPRPIAAFSVDRNTGEAPLVVRFTNRSSGQISGYGWNFGDGSSSAEASPVHEFRNAGEYEVKLTVVGGRPVQRLSDHYGERNHRMHSSNKARQAGRHHYRSFTDRSTGRSTTTGGTLATVRPVTNAAHAISSPSNARTTSRCAFAVPAARDGHSVQSPLHARRPCRPWQASHHKRREAPHR